MAVKATNFARIRISLIGFASVGALVIAVVSSIAAVVPMYRSLESSVTLAVVHDVESLGQSVGEVVRRISSLTSQVGSRTRARQLLAEVHANKITVDEYRAASTKMLEDAMAGSQEVVGIVRLSAQGDPLIEIGLPLPQSLWPPGAAKSDKMLYNGPFEMGGKFYTAVSAPIYDRERLRIGTDVIAYDAASVVSLLGKVPGQESSKTSFLVYDLNGQRTLLGAPDIIGEIAGGRQIVPYADAAVAKVVPVWSALIANTGESSHDGRRIHLYEGFLYGHVPIADGSWSIVLRVDRAAAFAALNQQIKTTIVVVLVLTMLGAMGIYFLVRPLAGVLQREIEAKTSDLAAELQERRRIENSLRESQATLRAVIDAVPACIDAKDALGRYVFMNAYQAEIAGIDPEEAPGKSHNDFAGRGHDTSFRDADETVMRSQKPLYNFEVQSQSFKGEARYWLSNKVPIKDSLGNTEMVVSVSLDITKRKEAEAEKAALEQELRRAQKLESLGTLAGGVAHEINTPSQYVGDNVRFLQGAFVALADVCGQARSVANALKAGPAATAEVTALGEAIEKSDLDYLLDEVPTSLQQSLDGIERIREIVSAIKKFSHPDVGEKVPINVREAIETTIVVSRNQWKHVATLVSDFAEDMPPLPCLPGEFNQVILNLIVNSAQAIEESVRSEPGKIFVSARPDNGWLEIRVGDNGTGIKPENLDRIFDMFFTTKAPGKGTGQGLAICHSIVTQKHGGTISVESKLGLGTTFIVRLPLIAADPPLAAAG